MAGQTKVSMVLINTATQEKGRTDLLEGRFLLWFDAGGMLVEDHDLYPPSNRWHFAALAAAELNTSVREKPTQSPPFLQKLQFLPSACFRYRKSGTGYGVPVTLPRDTPAPLQPVGQCYQRCSWTAASAHARHLPYTWSWANNNRHTIHKFG